MTSNGVIEHAVDNTNGQKIRNKNSDAYGNKYDSRRGYWYQYDEAVKQFNKDMSTWVDVEHCLAELKLINEGKQGRPFEYPPSIIFFLSMQKENMKQSYREIVGTMEETLSILGLKMPSYKTVQRNKDKFFGAEGNGSNVMRKADGIIGGKKGDFDPTMFMDSEESPEYSAPQKIPVCDADVSEQEEKDAKAAEIRRSMTVMVNREYVGKDVECALDGSGMGTKGNGIYIELIWSLNERNFIKQHTLLDIQTQKVVSFSITPEAPGDSKVMPAILKGTVKMGVGLTRILADGAYDTIDNWLLTEEMNIDFNPNLRERFKKDRVSLARRAKRALEEALGKKRHHRVSGYNMRWLVESFFSVIKKLYGERVKDRQFRRMATTMMIRYTMYNIRRNYILRRVDKHHELDNRLTVAVQQKAVTEL